MLGAWHGVGACGRSPEVRCPAAYGESTAWKKASGIGLGTWRVCFHSSS